MTLPLFAVGFLSILGQVILLRELHVILYGVELIYILAMASWLLWSGAGALWGPRFRVPDPSTVGLAFIVFSVIFFGDVLFIRYFRTVAGGFPGTYLPFPIQLLACGTALFPVGLFMGLLFQWCAKIRVAQSGTLARAYALESAGGIAGGAGATLFFFAGIQNLTAAWICAGVAALTWSRLRTTTHRRRWTAGVTVGVLTAGFFFLPELDRATLRWNHPDLVAARDTPYGRLVLTRRADQFVLFENDVLHFETQNVDAESLAHLAALGREPIRTAAVLGGGMEGLLHELLQHRPRSVDYVEIDPGLVDILRKHLPEDWTAVLDRPSVRLVQDDPRRFLETAHRYDLLLVGRSQPDSGAANRFFTREFFRLCRAHLNPRGILAFRLQSAENLWSPLMTRRNASIWQALTSQFPHAVALPGPSVIMLASPDPVSWAPEPLIERLEARRIRTRLVSPPYIRYLFTNDRFFETARLLNARGVAPNTDTRPVSYPLSVLIWLSKFIPSLIHARPAGSGALFFPAILVVVVAAVGWGLRRKPRLKGIFWMGTAGFVGMGLETLVLLYYQAGCGILYQNVGCLIMAFMAGLAAGAYWLPRRPAPGPRGVSPGPLYFLLAAVIAGSLAVMMAAHVRLTLPLASAFLFLTGGVVAGVFVVTGSGGPAHQKRAASEIYAADLVGGCLGAIAGSLWLVPFSGMLPAAAVVVGISLAGAVWIRS